MNNRTLRAAYALFAAIAATISGVLFLRRLRREPPPAAEPSTPEPVPISALIPNPTEPGIAARGSSWMIIRAGGGLGCFIVAQSLLMGSRNPVVPLMLYGVGVVLWLGIHPSYGAGAHQAAPLRMAETAPIIGFMLIAAGMQISTSPAIAVNNLVIVAVIPVIYALGRLLANPLTGIMASGLAAVSLWTLGLGKVDGEFAVLALWSAVFLMALVYAGKTRTRIAWGAALVAGMGTIFLREFAALLLLLPVLFALTRDSDSLRQRLIRNGLLILVCLAAATFFLFPGFLNAETPIPDYAKQVGINPTIAASDAYFSGLLLFIWTSDPNPLHGIINRPIFDPILAGAFLAGLLGLIVVYIRGRDWRAGLLIAGLLVGLLPQTALINPPISYPNLQWAALAFPAAIVIAAWGLSRVALLARDIWGLNGLRWALIVFAVALFFIASDAHFHYTKVFSWVVE